MTRLLLSVGMALALATPGAAGGFAEEIAEPPRVVVETEQPLGSLPGWIVPAVIVAGLVALAASGDDTGTIEVVPF